MELSESEQSTHMSVDTLPEGATYEIVYKSKEEAKKALSESLDKLRPLIYMM